MLRRLMYFPAVLSSWRGVKVAALQKHLLIARCANEVSFIVATATKKEK